MTKTLTYVEIDIPYCSLTYGVAPCTAAIGVTGTHKCFNTLGSCQDRLNFTDVPETLRFSINTNFLPDEIEALPMIRNVAFTPSSIALGESLGTRATVTVNLFDRPHSDTGPGGDKYLADRDYNPFNQGSYWGKFRNRNRFLEGRPLRWIQGKVGQSLAEMTTRHFIITSFSGPDANGMYTLTAKDPIKLLDGDKAQCPRPSNGYLGSAITNSATSATLLPIGIGNLEYPASGTMSLGGTEVVTFTRSGDSLTLVRGQQGTVAVAHAAQDRAQLCAVWTAIDPSQIIADLMEDYGGIPGSYIPITEWLDETDNFYRRVLTACIAEPMSVKKLINEIIVTAGLVVWWDDIAQKIKLQVLRDIVADAKTYTDSINIIKGSLSIKEQPEKRISQILTYFGPIDPLKSMEDPNNFKSSVLLIDAQVDQPEVLKKVYTRWVPAFGRVTAQRTNDIWLGRFREPPRELEFAVARRDDIDDPPALGGGYRVSAWSIQDELGLRQLVPVQVTRLSPVDEKYGLRAEEIRFTSLDSGDLDQRVIIIDGTNSNLNIRTIHDTLYPIPDHKDKVTVIIQPGAVLAALLVGSYGLQMGSWPTLPLTGNRTNGSAVITGLSSTTDLAPDMIVTGTGIPVGARILTVDSASQITLNTNAVTGTASTALTFYTVVINVINKGRIIGAGGNGGSGSYGSSRVNATSGTSGGPAFLVDYPIYLDNTLGQIWSGGGGGGGAGTLQLSQHAGGGGGGGAGKNAGVGGPGYSGGGPNAEYGASGSETAGGTGGSSYASFSWSQWPYYTGVRGGSGGGPGLSGGSGGNHGGQGFEQQVGSGGPAGSSIVGLNKVINLGTGDRRGPTVA